MKPTVEQLFIRQTTLTEVGKSGQQKLQQTSILIVGCGGLGNTVATSLAGSGIGEVHLVDFDIVEVTNLHRQLFFTLDDVGKPKAEVLGKYLKKIAPFTAVFVHNLTIDKQNVFDFIAKTDYVIDCTDSLPTKYVLNDACVIKNKPLVYGSLYKYDGYVASFNVPGGNGSTSANLRDAFPEIPKDAIPNCSEIGTLNTIVSVIGSLQANEVLKLVCGIGNPLINKLLIYNSLENSQYKMKLQQSFDKERISQLFEKETYFDSHCEMQDQDLIVTSSVLKELLKKNPKKAFRIISVIEDISTPLPFKVDAKIPISSFDEIVGHIELSRDIINEPKYIIVCQKGVSSYTVTQKIKEQYPELTVLSLKGGISNY